jgi:bacillithiol system protein YtxJ
MDWITLGQISDLDRIDLESHDYPVLIFKHSTRCSISSTALNRIRSARPGELGEDTVVYVLDLLTLRPVSDAIATRYGIHHESPQAILIRHGKPVYHASHLAIMPAEIRHAASIS